MATRPAHLTLKNAARFQEQAVAEAYPLRLPYPPEVFDTLRDLLPDSSRAVLDVGAGTGDIARQVVDFATRVDAVDWSPAMIDKGRHLPGGDHPHLHWIQGRVEAVALDPPYGLVTAGESLHWMDWETVFPKFRDVLSFDGWVVMIGRRPCSQPWGDDMQSLVVRYSTFDQYESFDLVQSLADRRLFRKAGEHITAPMTLSQSVDDYIESWHSRSSLTRAGMTPQNLAAFDDEVRALVTPYADAGVLTLCAEARLIWGKM